jgi:phage portal protein BeeE
MPAFGRKRAAISSPELKAAVGGLYRQNTGPSMIGQYYTYQEGELRNLAVSVPAISRALNLFKSVIGAMPLRMYQEKWTAGTREKVYLDPRTWLRRPDPTVPYQFLMAWTLDDLVMYGRAFWHVQARTRDGFPAAFTRLPAGSITTTDMTGPVYFAPSKQVYFQGGMLDPNDLVQFLSPAQGIVYAAPNAIETALKIEQARNRNASSAIPSGILQQQDNSEPMSAEELTAMVAAFEAARRTNQTAALNQYVKFQETVTSPDKMLLIESANYSALEAARLASVPPYLVGVSTGSYSYQSSEQARMDLWLFGVKLYAEAIAETLSMDNVLPRGTFVEFDPTEYLATNYGMDNTGMDIQDNGDVEDSPEENTGETLAAR